MRPGRPYHVPSAIWALIGTGAFIAAVLAERYAGGGSAIFMALAPFAGLTAALASRRTDYRSPTPDEARILLAAERLTGHTDLNVVKLPRSRRVWADAILTGTGVALGVIVIALAIGDTY
ncbi:MAG: hypothetical protein ACK4FB_08895 [Brevundimonas sp.]|uniref:hypothetical protein n=1 Tax=Brevundimonas sp. TaxID=1871086 RepID=UPI00391D50B6